MRSVAGRGDHAKGDAFDAGLGKRGVCLHDIVEGQALVGHDLDGTVFALAFLPGLGQALEIIKLDGLCAAAVLELDAAILVQQHIGDVLGRRREICLRSVR